MTEQTGDATAPYLDDPIAFAHELYSSLGAGGDGRLITPTPKSYAAFVAAAHRLGELLPAESAARDAADTAEELARNWSNDNYAAGIEFGVAAEQLRRALLDSARGPRIPWAPSACPEGYRRA